jgi:chemotaxis protein methyltransferase CheR
MKIDILATDLSISLLEYARKGIYFQHETQRGLPIQVLLKNFTQIGEQWKINTEIAKMVRFEKFNLLNKMEKLGRFHIIFCRNVLINLDGAVQKSVLEKLAAQMNMNGILCLGSGESTLDVPAALAPIPGQPCFFVRTDSPLHPPAFPLK